MAPRVYDNLKDSVGAGHLINGFWNLYDSVNRLIRENNQVVAIFDTTGAEVVGYSYDAWGNPLDTTGSMKLSLGLYNPLRYRGYVYDQETGLYYVSSRYYNPETGRWINADNQIAGVGGEVLGYNMFAYCQNNPVNMSDLGGHWPRWITASVAMGASIIGYGAFSVGFYSLSIAATGASILASAGYVAQVAHYDLREHLNTNLPESPRQAEEWDWRNSNPIDDDNPNGGGPKADCHQYTSPNKSNVKWVSPDGHREIIFDSKGQVVSDPRDEGTYNFCPAYGAWYTNESIGHFCHEIIPWVIFGNNDEDPGPIINEMIRFFE